jgi:NTP pyrophosphatase (non-canonical NTP hydrolase)
MMERTNDNSLTLEDVKQYYVARGLVVPNVWESLAWAATEAGEVYEVLLRGDKEWVRNNKDKEGIPYLPADLAEELGDQIMMLIVAGWAEGVDPIAALKEKMRRKLGLENGGG